jgi:uncharacterized protein
MKNYKSIVSIFLFFTICQLSSAQQKEVVLNSPLWKIEHSSLEKPSYIFGTIHLMCEDDFSIPEKVNRALSEVEELVLEINFSDPGEMQALQTSMASSKKISEELSEAQFHELDAFVNSRIGMGLANFDNYGLSGLNSILISKMLPCEKMKLLEFELIAAANKKEKSINGLEKVDVQMEFFAKAYPADFMFKQLMLFDSYKIDFNNAIEFYKEENIDKTAEMITKDKYMDANAVEHMLTIRNSNWANKMPEMMKNKSALFAVGAAHLKGVIELLSEQGYSITPVID